MVKDLTDQHPLFEKWHRDTKSGPGGDADVGAIMPVREKEVARPKSHCPNEAKAALRRGVVVKRFKNDPNAPNANIKHPPPPPPRPVVVDKGVKRQASQSVGARVVMRGKTDTNRELFQVTQATDNPSSSSRSGGNRSSGSRTG